MTTSTTRGAGCGSSSWQQQQTRYRTNTDKYCVLEFQTILYMFLQYKMCRFSLIALQSWKITSFEAKFLFLLFFLLIYEVDWIYKIVVTLNRVLNIQYEMVTLKHCNTCIKIETILGVGCKLTRREFVSTTYAVMLESVRIKYSVTCGSTCDVTSAMFASSK